MNRGIVKARGAVLIVSLVILLVLTLLGISTMDRTLMQERMAGNLQESLSAFQAAEAGLRDGERDVRGNIASKDVFTANCTDGLCQPADTSTSPYLDVWGDSTRVSPVSGVSWDPNNAASDVNTRQYGAYTNVDALQNVSRLPAYIIERLQVADPGGSIVAGFSSQPPSEWYRITARGFGRNGQSQSTLQSVYRK